MSGRYLPVPDGLAGERADAGLARLLGMSRAKVATLLSQGHIRQGGQEIDKSAILRPEWILEVEIPAEKPVEITPTAVPDMQTVWEDEDLIIVNKPAGVAAHSGPGWDGPTVVGALRAAGRRISTSGPPEREGIVHRLDAGTSGLMIVAKSELAYGRLKNMFRYHEVTKVYHALVQGHLDPWSGTIDAPIGRHPGREFKMCVLEGGKPSITHYDTLEVLPGATLAQVHLETGRTHQIRVHFSALHHPCLGDDLYGADGKMSARLGLIRQWLHACQLIFAHPRTGVQVKVECDYADDLSRALEILRNQS